MAKSSHPGVIPYLKRSTFCVRLKLNGKDARKSLATADADQADKLCQILWQIQQGQPYEFSKTPVVVRQILGLKDPSQQRTEELENAIENVIPQGSNEVLTLAELTDKYKQALDNKDRELELAHNKIRQLEEQLAGVESMLRATGREKLTRVKPVTVATAIENFLKDGTRASTRTTREYKSQLDAFARVVDGSKQLSEITPEKVCRFLESCRDRCKPAYLRKWTITLVAMLKHATGGDYPLVEINEWRKRNLESSYKADEDFYWLAIDDVENLAEQAERLYGRYWADAIRIQFYLGLRPEELTFLQTKNVKADFSEILIRPLSDKDIVSRGVKTDRSAANLPIDPVIRSAIKRRVASGSALLFPCDREELSMEVRSIASQSTFEQEIGLWLCDTFNKRYVEMLRNSAVSLNIETDRVDWLDPERIDGRTMRRSRGKHLLDSGIQPAKAAAFLRDALPTFLKHYARFLPTDLELPSRKAKPIAMRLKSER